MPESGSQVHQKDLMLDTNNACLASPVLFPESFQKIKLFDKWVMAKGR